MLPSLSSLPPSPAGKFDGFQTLEGFVPVPVGMAGPLTIHGSEDTDDDFFIPLATAEPTMVASCSRGCKAFNACGGLRFRVLGEGMSRAPIFFFASPGDAAAFAERVPGLEKQLAADAESTSRCVRLQRLTPHVVGSAVHVKFSYSCGDAVGQNMVTIATQRACDRFAASDAAKAMGLERIAIEGGLASDRKASWEPRGVRVLAWGELSDETCNDILGCSSERLYTLLTAMEEGQARGQDAGSMAEAPRSHLAVECDGDTKDLKLALFLPCLPVGVATGSEAQRASLGLAECRGPGMKRRLAGLIACSALALDLSTAAALANGTFAASHESLARGKAHGQSRL